MVPTGARPSEPAALALSIRSSENSSQVPPSAHPSISECRFRQFLGTPTWRPVSQFLFPTPPLPPAHSTPARTNFRDSAPSRPRPAHRIPRVGCFHHATRHNSRRGCGQTPPVFRLPTARIPETVLLLSTTPPPFGI